MSLKLSLRNYRAIESADVELSDLTVLAGVNGSGKSTVVRLFHRLVCLESDLSRYAGEAAYSRLCQVALRPLASVLPDVFDTKSFSWPKRIASSAFPAFIEKLREGFHLYVQSESVREKLNDVRLSMALKRAVASVNPPFGARPDDPGGLNAWIDLAIDDAVKQYEMYVGREQGSSDLFFKASVVSEDLSTFGIPDGAGTLLEEMLPSKPQPVIQFEDGNVPVVDSNDRSIHFPALYTPRRSFYIARPSVDFPSLTATRLKLNGVEYSIRGRFMSSEDHAKVSLGIEALMGGAISAPREKSYVGSSDWLFSDGHGETFGLNACADGIKSLATVSILDRYGLLNDGALLIIDEPEVHLHPQWIVGMARILVRLAKYRKVRVLITTHSPDMVHALRDFSENENFGGQTQFYLSSHDMSSVGYQFKPLGRDIGPIFTVFNRAKESIYAIAKSMREGSAT